MRVLVACLAVATLVHLAAADRFRTVLVGGNTDWTGAGGDKGCDICSSGGHGQQGGGYHRSSSSRSSQFASSGGLSDRLRSPWPAGDHLGAGLTGRSGGRRRTYHFSSEESEYTFSNGTHSTTITSKRSTEGVPEFHLKMTRLRDGAVIESTVLTETEYRLRRAELGLTGSDGSFGFESLGGGGGDIHGLSTRRLSGESLLTDLERRLGQRRGGHSRSYATSFSSEESHYSFSNGTHTTSITGRRNSDGVREYGLELIRDSDGAVLDRATISEAEYNRRRQSISGGEGFDNVFDIHGIHGSRSRSEFESRHDSRSRSRYDDRSDSRSGSRFDARHNSRSDARSKSRSEFGSTSEESEFGLHTGDRRPVPSSRPGSSGSHSTTYFREERTESHRQEGGDTCSCVARPRCDPSDRVLSAETLLRCGAGKVCCRSPGEEQRPLLPLVPTEEPRRPRTRRPEAEPQVRPELSCSCVPRNSCARAERVYSIAGLNKCHHPMVCCNRQLTPAPHVDDRPLLPTSSPSGRRPAPRPVTRIPKDVVQQDRELFRDIVQHVDTEEAPVQRPLNTNALQNSLSRYDDAHDVPGGHRRTEISRTEHSRTVSSGGRYEPRPTADGEQHSSSSSRRHRYSSRTGSSTSEERRDLERTRPGFPGHGLYDALSQRQRTIGDQNSEEQIGGSRVISSSRRYSSRRVISGDDSDDDDRPLLDTARLAGQHQRNLGDRASAEQSGGSRVISSSRRYSSRRVISGDDSDEDDRPLLDTARLAGQHQRNLGDRASAEQSGGSRVISSSRRYSSRRVISGDDSDEDDRPLLDGSRPHLPGSDLGLSSSRQYSYQHRSSSSSSDLGEGGRLLGADGAGQRQLTSGHRVTTDQYGEPAVVTSSSRRHSVTRTYGAGGVGSGGDVPGSDLGLSTGGSGLSSSSSRRYSERRVVSGDADGADLGLGLSGTDGAGLGVALSGAGLGGAHSSGSRYSSSSSWSSRSESGSAGGQLPGGSYSYQSVPAGSSGSSYRYSSSSSSQTVSGKQATPSPSSSQTVSGKQATPSSSSSQTVSGKQATPSPSSSQTVGEKQATPSPSSSQTVGGRQATQLSIRPVSEPKPTLLLNRCVITNDQLSMQWRPSQSFEIPLPTNPHSPRIAYSHR